MNLHSIASAKAYRSAATSRQIFKHSQPAGGTLRIARRLRNLADLPFPNIYGGNARFNGTGHQPTHRIRRLQRANGGSNGPQHTIRFAGGLGTAGRIRIDAAQTGRFTRNHRHGDAIAAYGGPVDPRNPFPHAVIVDEIAGFKVVGAVQHKVRPVQQFFNVGWVQIGNVGGESQVRVDAGQGLGSGLRFGQSSPGIGIFKQHLTLQVAGFYKITINDGEIAYASAAEQSSVKTSQSPTANNGHAGVQQQLLPGFSNGRKKNLPGIPFLIARIHQFR